MMIRRLITALNGVLRDLARKRVPPVSPDLWPTH